MSDKKEIEIEGKNYEVEKLSETSIKLINQVQDLDNKIRKSKFNLAQLEGGRKYFYEELLKVIEE